MKLLILVPFAFLTIFSSITLAQTEAELVTAATTARAAEAAQLNLETTALDEYLLANGIVAGTDVQRVANRLYSLPNAEFPDQIKCGIYDFRSRKLCPDVRLFDPSTRVYFDTGADESDEIDIFVDGGLSISLEVASVYFPQRFGKSYAADKWSWGPQLGIGLSTPAQAEGGSSAPVALFSLGGLVEYSPSGDGTSFGFEFGFAQGISSDESLEDKGDGAFYLGLKISVP